MPDWTKPFILDTDASDTGIAGAVLSQCRSEHVIAHSSRLLTKLERNYCVTRNGFLAVVTFLHHFHHYLLSKPFMVHTDHGALTWLQRNEMEVIVAISSNNIIGGHTLNDLRELQMENSVIRPLLRAMEADQKSSNNFAKTQCLEYRRLYQQWNQLIVEDDVLWCHYAQPNHNYDWLQLLGPKQLRPQVLEDLHLT